MYNYNNIATVTKKVHKTVCSKTLLPLIPFICTVSVSWPVDEQSMRLVPVRGIVLLFQIS